MNVFSQHGVGYIRGLGEKNNEIKDNSLNVIYFELNVDSNCELFGSFSGYAFTLYIGRSQIRHNGQKSYNEWNTGCMLALPGSEGHITFKSASKFKTLLVSHRFVEAVIDDPTDYKYLSAQEAPSDKLPIVKHLLGAMQSAASTEISLNQTFLESVAVAMVCATAGISKRNMINIALSPVKMMRVVEFVEENLSKSLSLSEVAAETGLKVRQLTYGFKQAYGMPIYRYILIRRIDRAITLLRLGLSVGEVAYLVGFDSRTSLSRAMQNLAGMTTTDARKGARLKCLPSA